MTRRPHIIAACAFVVALAGAVSAQSVDEGTDEVGVAGRADRPMPGQEARPTITPQQEPWFRSRATRVGVPASSVDLDPAVIGPLPGQAAPPLHREGDFIVHQLGRLHPLPSSAIAFELIDEAPDGQGQAPETRVMVLQPSQRLETMLSVAEQQGGGVLFRLTGQVYVYRGVNYLLPTALTGYQTDEGEELDAHGEPVAEQDAEAPSVLEVLEASDALDEPLPDRVGATDTPDDQDPLAMMNAMADELAAEATKIQAGSTFAGAASPVRPALPRVGDGGASGGGTKGASRREGEFIVSRAGRLVRSADMRNVLFTFEADGPEMAEPPIGVLPCRLRAWMEDAVVRRGDAQVFVVSGRVYRYLDRDFFLPSVVKLRVGDDNLGG